MREKKDSLNRGQGSRTREIKGGAGQWQWEGLFSETAGMPTKVMHGKLIF